MNIAKKQLTVILLLVVSAVVFGSCVSRLDAVDISSERKKFIFAETSAQGYELASKTANAQYFFSGRDVNENTRLIQNVETTMSVSRDVYKMTMPSLPLPRIYFTKDINDVSMNFSRLVITTKPDEPSQYGVVFYFMSESRLPAWLCAGLELYWSEQYGIADCLIETDKHIDAGAWTDKAREQGLPKFGDEWFVPGLITDNLSENVIMISYEFVKYLEENGVLTELISLYLDEDRAWDSERKCVFSRIRMRLEEWRKFASTEPVDGKAYIFRYMYDQYKSTYTDITFCVLAEHGKYFFTRENWTMDMINSRVETGETGISYVKNWFCYSYEKPIEVIYEVKEALNKSTQHLEKMI